MMRKMYGCDVHYMLKNATPSHEGTVQCQTQISSSETHLFIAFLSVMLEFQNRMEDKDLLCENSYN
jgi:hypothetical protein